MRPAQALVQAEEPAYVATLDLAALARVNRGDRIEVERLADRTQELFERTLRVLDPDFDAHADPAGPAVAQPRFVPEHQDLRSRFLFAEALGSYSTVQDLLDAYSPGYKLSIGIGARMHDRRLSEAEVRTLVEYDRKINTALRNASQFLLENPTRAFSYEEIQELNALLLAARERSRAVTAILGEHLIHEVELAVQRLYEFQCKIRSVQKSVDGIFLIDSEVMFIPTQDLVRCVESIFAAIGNPHVAEHIDGLLLLAARNLLIDTVSFYSYYGKQQIYNVFRRRQATVNGWLIAHHVRLEIRRLFDACKADNKLVLTRIMDHAAREFEISVETIQAEAERSAVEAVTLLIPPEAEVAPPAQPGLLQRIATWLFR